MRNALEARLRRLAREADAGFRTVHGAVDAGLAPSGSETAESGAEVLEDDRLRARAVGEPAGSGFTCFLDGIQRARVALYHGPAPIVIAHGAAVVRHRRTRRLETLDPGHGRGRSHGGRDGGGAYLIEREAVFASLSHVPRARFAAAAIDADALIDTDGEDGGPVAPFPPVLHARAAQRVNRWRESLERRLAERWCAADDDPGWLLVDGSLTLSAALAESRRAVGVVKGHRTRFFDGDEGRVVATLRVGERTSVFRPASRSFTPVHSWYLRLREPAGRDAFWGLVRVEAAPADDSAERADEVSRWLLAERAPIALPDPRWDRLLYPIRDCEAFLRARAPVWREG